ncbi:transmembrane protein, putative (macronuclear) [Tetrahymena thermophila SB210]|uniref:Transmembrane protein, putative n=1 Tax=Tetrahymena thermophila (strain SB210) TaxID=312017 RepID=Q238V0_TETTS|nr:transmembrane protein, putative [Tetrahymena thermophila SB210]EAR93120.1 transmembrane protein, putative [Tetrahymena thermophila SB210]|eukprot:XP_001013365.1 transmembrane protein, putative [Tetrahymena thermophila SB210]
MKTTLITAIGLATLLAISTLVLVRNTSNLKDIRYYDECTELQTTESGIFVVNTCLKFYKFTIVPNPQIKKNAFTTPCLSTYEMTPTDFTQFTQVSKVNKVECKLGQ